MYDGVKTDDTFSEIISLYVNRRTHRPVVEGFSHALRTLNACRLTASSILKRGSRTQYGVVNNELRQLQQPKVCQQQCVDSYIIERNAQATSNAHTRRRPHTLLHRRQ